MNTNTISCRWVFDDGGRAEAGFSGKAGDCVARALAIAGGMSYGEAYRVLAQANEAAGHPRSARNGVGRTVFEPVFNQYGFTWTPTMKVGSGCRVHLRREELPEGRIIARLSRHLVAVIDGVIRDTFDPSRGGTRCVYGYWTLTD
jgi:hypothetical protein